MKLTRVATLITFVVAIAATIIIHSGVLASTFAEETSPPAELDPFSDVAAAAERPADGLDLYDNIHRYMWRPVYMMAAVDLYLSESEDGEYSVSLKRDTESGPVCGYTHLGRSGAHNGGFNLQHHCTTIGFWWRPQHYS